MEDLQTSFPPSNMVVIGRILLSRCWHERSCLPCLQAIRYLSLTKRRSIVDVNKMCLEDLTVYHQRYRVYNSRSAPDISSPIQVLAKCVNSLSAYLFNSCCNDTEIKLRTVYNNSATYDVIYSNIMHVLLVHC